MRNRFFLPFSTCIILTLLWSCNSKDKLQPPQLPKESYQPIKEDKYLVYHVIELTHNSFESKTDTSYYLIKETYESPFDDLEGNKAFRIRVERSDTGKYQWNFDHFATIHKDQYGVERVEFDQRKVKHSFPIENDKRWDINLFNEDDIQYGFYSDLDQATTINNKTYPLTVYANLGERSDFISTYFDQELYARGIGLIWQKYVDIETQPGKYKNGIETTKTIIETNW